jgi:aminopeptidase 2
LLSTDPALPASFNTQQLSLPNHEPNAFKLNSGGSGFYRTIYNASHLQALASQVKTGHFEPLDRLGILADVTEAAKTGTLDAAEALHLLTAYENEEDNAVWDVMATTLGSIRSVMDNEAVREAMKPFVRKLTAKQVKRLGWEAQPHESHFDRLLRPTILGMAAAGDEPEVVSYAQDRFAEMHDPSDLKPEMKSAGDRQNLRANNLDPDLRSVVYGTMARTGGEAEFNKLLAMHNHTTSNEEKLTLCSALCSFKQPALVARSLELIRSEYVRLQDVAYWLAYAFMNRHARAAAWEWVKDNWEWLDKNLGTDLAFYRLPIYVARGFSDEKFTAEYQKFFTKVMSPALERSFNQGVEMIQWQSAWKRRDLKLVKAFFKV